MAVDPKDERVGIVGGKRATLNILGQPFSPPAITKRNIGSNQYVVMDGVPATADVEAALKNIGVAAKVIDATPEPTAAVGQKKPAEPTNPVEGGNG